MYSKLNIFCILKSGDFQVVKICEDPIDINTLSERELHENWSFSKFTSAIRLFNIV